MPKTAIYTMRAVRKYQAKNKMKIKKKNKRRYEKNRFKSKFKAVKSKEARDKLQKKALFIVKINIILKREIIKYKRFRKSKKFRNTYLKKEYSESYWKLQKKILKAFYLKHFIDEFKKQKNKKNDIL